MASETFSWKTLTGGVNQTITNQSLSLDTGQTIVGVSSKVASTSAVRVVTTDTNPNPTSFPADSRLSWTGNSSNASRGTMTFNFKDDPSDTQTVAAENVKFSIYDIDAGSSTSSGFRDRVIIRAYDTDGNAIPVTATTGTGVITQGLTGGGLQLTAKLNTNSLNSPAQAAQISIVGPVAYYTIEFFNDGLNANNILISDASFTSVVTQPCFARGTMILTERGTVAIEDLAEGDMVMTRDNGAQPIRWIGSSSINLDRRPHLAPIRIRAGALGAGQPTADLLVSPQHRILVQSAIAQRLFGAPEVLVAAKQLLQVDGIDIATDLAEVDYFHMLFDAHEVVTSNGAASESLFTGPEALKAVGAAARAEILAIFPELARRDYQPVGARILASGRMGRKLAVRHAQNGKPLVQ
ncbi:Hint domain-containing protein [Paracoccus sp. p4-l81]|uniref:Hint domain-containing protein n=1 Tax=Paracoccus sp. p4-l81 TaxID=3342806 RepID=UPI0035B81899